MTRLQPRTARVYLDPSEPRCEPATHCGIRDHCARYMAEIPQQYAIIADYSLGPKIVCPMYVPASKCLKPEPPKPVPTKRHWSDHEQ
jgi:hypothetical protein